MIYKDRREKMKGGGAHRGRGGGRGGVVMQCDRNKKGIGGWRQAEE